MEITATMREIIDENAKCQNQLIFVPSGSKTIFDAICFRLFLIMIKKILLNNLLKNFMIADESSVRELRVFYLPLLGENTK